MHHQADGSRSRGPSCSSTHLRDKEETSGAHNGTLSAMSQHSCRCNVGTVLRNAMTAEPGSRSEAAGQLAGGGTGDTKQHGEGSVVAVLCGRRRMATPHRLHFTRVQFWASAAL